MEIEQINTIKSTIRTLSQLIKDITPENDIEWDAMEKLTSAHHLLRQLDLGKLGQMKLPPPLEPKNPPKEQIPLPDSAAVQHGEDSLNEDNPPIHEEIQKSRRRHATA